MGVIVYPRGRPLSAQLSLVSQSWVLPPVNSILCVALLVRGGQKRTLGVPAGVGGWRFNQFIHLKLFKINPFSALKQTHGGGGGLDLIALERARNLLHTNFIVRETELISFVDRD